MPKPVRERNHRVTFHPYAKHSTGATGSKPVLDTSKPETPEIPTLNRGQKKRQERKDRVQMKLGKGKTFEKMVQKAQTGRSLDGSSSGIEGHASDDMMVADEAVSAMLSELEASILNSSTVGDNVIKSSAATTSNKLKQQIAVREAARLLSRFFCLFSHTF